jgi:signal transduction histidine kinase
VSAVQPDECLNAMLDFVAKVTASATHEIKNELAVINEQSRLLQEMLAMARQGREVDPERLEQLIGRVVARVGQADQAVRRLNAFAHSADLDRNSTNPDQTLEALLRLFARIASLKGVDLDLQSTQAGGEIGLRPILFEQAVWTCLESAVRQAGKGSRLKISATREQNALTVLLQIEPRITLQAPYAEPLCLPAADIGITPDGGMVLKARVD